MYIDNPFEGNDEKKHNFSTYHGVFRPTFLTIIGVMLFLRQGWVVGNAGLLGAIVVILMAFTITGLTALSIASIATNVRIRSGGVFSLVSQSLGLEMGGAIGIPLYLAQGLSGALYIRGFAEGWLLFFPTHNINYVLGVFWLVVFCLCFISTKLIFQIQSITFVLIFIAIICLLASSNKLTSFDNIVLWGNFEDGSIWKLFAVFFPAATGIMVGASMSGNLRNSRYSIPIGTLSAWVVTLVIYILAALSYSIKAPSDVLITQHFIGISGGLLGSLAAFGLLISCFSATLSSLAAAPQVLQALGDYEILGQGFGFQKKSKRGESSRALMFTAFLILITIFTADLNTIAEILTIFFILTYFIINIVLLVEKKVDMISFRPELSLPLICPFLGSLFCFIAILIISPIFGLLALFFVLILYFYLTTKKLKAPWETVNSGLLLGLVNWAVRRLSFYSQTSVRAWKPDVIVPIYQMEEIDSLQNVLHGLIRRRGSVKFVAFHKENKQEVYFDKLRNICNQWFKEGLFASFVKIEASDFFYGLRCCLSLNKADILNSSLVLTDVHYRSNEEIKIMFEAAKKYKTGAIYYCGNSANHQDENIINLWIRDQSPDWSFSLDSTNLDCQILLAYLFQESWGIKIRLISIVKDENCCTIAKQYLKMLVNFTRISKQSEIVVVQGNFKSYIKNAPLAKLSLFGLGDFVEKEFMENLASQLGSPCLFVKESGQESALA